MKQIQKYEPKHRVTLKDGTHLLVPSSKVEALKKDLETKKFITIEAVTIATRLIDKISEYEYDQLNDLPKDIRCKVEARIKEYERNLGKKPGEKTINNIIKKFIN